jgi:DNA repair exonuclease SbcCD ATPase subunit
MKGFISGVVPEKWTEKKVGAVVQTSWTDTDEFVRKQREDDVKREERERKARKERETELDRGEIRKLKEYAALGKAAAALKTVDAEVQAATSELKKLRGEYSQLREAFEAAQTNLDYGNISFAKFSVAENEYRGVEQALTNKREKYTALLTKQETVHRKYNEARESFADAVEKFVRPKLERAAELDEERRELEDECGNLWAQCIGLVPGLADKMVWRNFLSKYPLKDIARLSNLRNGKK